MMAWSPSLWQKRKQIRTSPGQPSANSAIDLSSMRLQLPKSMVVRFLHDLANTAMANPVSSWQFFKCRCRRPWQCCASVTMAPSVSCAEPLTLNDVSPVQLCANDTTARLVKCLLQAMPVRLGSRETSTDVSSSSARLGAAAAERKRGGTSRSEVAHRPKGLPLSLEGRAHRPQTGHQTLCTTHCSDLTT